MATTYNINNNNNAALSTYVKINSNKKKGKQWR